MAVNTIVAKKSSSTGNSSIFVPRISSMATIAPLRVLPITTKATSPKIALAVFTPEFETMNSFELSSVSGLLA